ncbi:MAG: metal-dependent hydrolase [Elusimicrobia bacterium]|nr:metal-dependent hydrolase [Elusimicrobiota bacterium]
MATPLFHSAVAISAAQLACREKPSCSVYLVFLTAANIADMDLLPGLLAGKPLEYHHLAAHSLAFALVMGGALATLLWKVLSPGGNTPYRTWLGALALTCLSHPALDLVTYDSFNQFPVQNYGLELGWPLSPRLIGPIGHVLPGPYFTVDWHDWIIADNLKIFATEGAIGAALVASAAGFRRPWARLPYPEAAGQDANG